MLHAKLVQQVKQPLELWQWKEVLEKKAHRGRLWKVFGSEQFLLGMWSISPSKGQEQGKILADAAREKQEGKQGQWQQEPRDADCGPQTMRRAYLAMKHGNWEHFQGRIWEGRKLCDWTFERIREAYEKAAKDGIGRLRIAQ